MFATTVDDLYTILNVSPSATADEIRRVYRRLALRWHPDRHMGDAAKAGATKRFAKISAAYTVLINVTMRREYDARRAADAASGARHRYTSDRAQSSESETSSSYDSEQADEAKPAPQPTANATVQEPRRVRPDIYAVLARWSRWIFGSFVPLFRRGCSFVLIQLWAVFILLAYGVVAGVVNAFSAAREYRNRRGVSSRHPSVSANLRLARHWLLCRGIRAGKRMAGKAAQITGIMFGYALISCGYVTVITTYTSALLAIFIVFGTVYVIAELVKRAC